MTSQVVGPLDYIAIDMTWTLANSPYTFAVDVGVAAGTTLTIEPGVEVRFGAGAGLDVHGKLRALGTFEQPIVLTGTTQQPGAWDGLALLGSASSGET